MKDKLGPAIVYIGCGVALLFVACCLLGGAISLFCYAGLCDPPGACPCQPGCDCRPDGPCRGEHGCP